MRARRVIAVIGAAALTAGLAVAGPGGAGAAPVTAPATAEVRAQASAAVKAQAQATAQAQAQAQVQAPAQATVTAKARPKAIKVPNALFGMHVADLQSGAWPTTKIGAIRLWDNDTAWSQVEKSPGDYSWGALDKAVATSQANGIKDILLVLGSTPKWAANPCARPSDPPTYGRPAPVANCVPRNFSDWDQWVTKVVTRYKGRITSYEVWNEASLRDFWSGTPAQMAELTQRAYKIIKAIDPKALVVAASPTTRGVPGFDPLGQFFPPYLQALKSRGWPVDVFSGHFYPPGTGTPNDRAKLIQALQAQLKAAGAPRKPLWDTESNFGLAGPSTIPKVEITGSKAAAWVSISFLDSLRLGVARSYWYEWISPFWLLGIQMYTGEPGATGLATTYGWLAGATMAKPCTSVSGLNTCVVTKAGKSATIFWMSTGSRTVKAPVGTTKRCTPMGTCIATKPGARVRIAGAPVWFGA